MKELSIEEKAKRYDEAIEIAKRINNEQQAQPFNVMTRVFPELKESEDERIRKELIAFVKSRLAGFPECDRFIAWLEKQGEQKQPKELTNSEFVEKCKGLSRLEQHILALVPTRPIDAIKVDARTIRYLVEQEQGEQKPVVPKFIVGDTVRAKTMNDFVFTIKDITDKQYIDTNGGKFDIEGQDYLELVKQNPAWSEDDQSNFNELSSFILETYRTEDASRLITWLKSLKDRVQPMQEWSEEDEAIYYGVIETEQYMLDVVNGRKEFDIGNESIKEECKKELAWLKSLKERVEPQLKQDWCEKDKCMLNNVIDTLKPLIQTTHSGYSINSMIDWLKSLKDRYTWKPSEEQMNALKHASNDCSIAFADMKILATLYEQLKTLHRYEQDT